MAFPTPAARDTWADNTAATSFDVPLSGLGTIAAGDGLVMIVAVDGGDEITDWDDWTEVMQDEPQSSIRIGVFYKDADGSDADPTLTIAGEEKIAVSLYRFAAADVDFSTDPPTAPSTAATASSTAPRPASYTPSGGAIDRLWLSCAANDDDDATTGFPTDYTNGQSQMSTGSGGCNVMTAERELSTASEQSAAFTIASTEDWAAVHVVVVSVGGASPQSITTNAAAEAEAAVSVAVVASGAPQSITTNTTTETEAAVTVAAEQSGAVSSGILALQAALE